MMKLAFSTLGCPNWELEDVARAAREYGYAGVELRALGGGLDLLSRPEFQPGEVARTRDRISDSLHEVARLAPRSVRVGLETHGDFAGGPLTAEIIRRADHPNLCVIWDAANTFASGEAVGASAHA